MVEIVDFDKIEQEQEIAKNALVQAETTEKSIADVTLSDVHFKVDSTATYEEQAEDVVNAMTIVKAVEDEGTRQALATGKQSELIGKQQAKIKKAQKEVVEAETNIQEAQYDNKKILFDTFNITAHLPRGLQIVVEPILAFFFIIFMIITKVPCGFARMLIDGIDSVLVRYEKKDEQTKPKIKVTVIIIIVLGGLGVTAIGVLKGLNII